jgi:glycosyltransferase involved in cell wall biosynthesis
VTFDPPQNIGGVEGRVQGYLTQLIKRGNFVEVEAFAPGYRFTKEGFHGSRLHKSPSETRSIIRSFRYTLRIISGDSIDSVFLLSGGITIFGNMLLLYCRMRRKRTAILLYGKDILQARKGRLGKILLFTSQLLTNQIVTNSRFTASLLPRYFQREIALLYPSVDPGILDAASTRVSTGGLILFVGRLVRRKGVDDLIAAFNLLQSDIPAARLEIVGDGPERMKLEKLVSDLDLGEKVSFLGSLKGISLNEKYLECDVFVMPSRTLKDDVEGFGTVFLEAGLAGKPSIGTNSGGIPEAVIDGQTGILVPEADIKGLASALKRVLSDETLRKRLGENAHRRVLAEFTWEATTRRLVEIMSEPAGT